MVDLIRGGVSLVLALGFGGIGLLMIAGALVTSRSWRSDLPDDALVADHWRRVGLRPVDEPPDTVLRAARRLEVGSGIDGHELFGLPGSAGLRLVASGRLHGHTVHVADVWDVTSKSSVGERAVDATVRLRAVAAVALDTVHDRVVAGPAGMVDELREAIGSRDVELESHEFNRGFAVRSDDRELAVAVLTPQVLAGLLDAQTLVLEVSGDLATVHEVTGTEHPSGGQAELGATFTEALDSILAGLRPHTWPTAAAPPDEPKSRGELAFDPRPPGATHGQGDRRTTLMVRLGLGSFGLVFTAFGVGAWLLR